MTDSVDIDDGIIWVDANVNIEIENRQAHQEFREFFGDIQIFVFEQSSDYEEKVRKHSRSSFLIIVSKQGT